jgi:hypothetical protein
MVNTNNMTKFNEQYTYFSSSKLEELKTKGIEIRTDNDKYMIVGNQVKAIQEGFVLDSKNYILEYIEVVPKPFCANYERDNLEFISQEAVKIVKGDRNTDYGSPVESFKKIANMASLLCNKEFTPLECLRVMKAVKLVRESYKHKEDNLVDLIGYTEIENMIINYGN